MTGRGEVKCRTPAAWSHNRAAALDHDDVAPAAVVLADAFPGPDHAEPGGLVQGEAGGVLREDAGLDGPDPGGLGGGDQRVQQPAAGALAAGGGGDGDRGRDDPGVDAAPRHGRGRPPPSHLAPPPPHATGRAPGRRTRKLSAKTAGRSVDRLIAQLEMITSTELSGSGIASICPRRNTAFSAPATRALARARSSIASVMSRPYALPAGPTRRAESSTSM